MQVWLVVDWCLGLVIIDKGVSFLGSLLQGVGQSSVFIYCLAIVYLYSVSHSGSIHKAPSVGVWCGSGGYRQQQL